MRIFLSALILIAVSTVAQADTIRRTIPANKTSPVGAHATYGPFCKAGAIPKMGVTKEPEHGTVSFKQVSYKLSEGAGRCAGQSVKGTAVYYKPKRG